METLAISQNNKDTREVGELLDDYISACMDKGIYAIRIIHGKGKGILKNRVCAHLEKHPAVASFADAPMNAGGWGRPW